MDDNLLRELEAAPSPQEVQSRSRSRSIKDRLFGAKATATALIRPAVEMLPFSGVGSQRRRTRSGDSAGDYARVSAHERGLLASPTSDAGDATPDVSMFMGDGGGDGGGEDGFDKTGIDDVEALLSGTADTVRDVWAPEANLDDFFTRMYRYYHDKGFPSILASHITSLITLAFTVSFSTFLLVFVDWPNLLTCGDTHTGIACKELDTYIKWEALDHPNLFQHLVFGYFFLFSGYWLITLLWSLPTLAGAWRMHVFYRDRLKISTRDLQTMDWTAIVGAFDRLHRSRQYRVQINRAVSAFHIASRVMRKDNYIIALMNKQMLDLRMPCCNCSVPLTKALEWNLHWTMLNHMFHHPTFRLRPEFVNDVAALQRRFIFFGMLNLLLLPFTLLFMVMYFFLKNAEEFHKKGDYLGPRKWSPRALWKFREFNELPHIFERRINGSYRPANEYEQQFPVPVLTVLAKCTAFVAGSMAAVLLLLTLVDEELLLHIHLADRNLLWYIAVFSGILAVSRAFIPTPEQSVLSPERAMRKLVAYTHYMPKRWRGRFNTYDVRDEFLDLYQFKVVLFLQEVLGAVTTPLVLLCVLPFRAPAIVEFLKRVTVTDDNLGSVCGYAMFDMRKFGNAKYGAPVHASKLWRSRQGKMEKSLLSFQANNPDWSAHEDGVELLKMLTQFQAEQSAAITGVPGPGLGMSTYGGGMGGYGAPYMAGVGMPGMAGTGFLGQPGATLPQGVPGWGIGASGTMSIGAQNESPSAIAGLHTSGGALGGPWGAGNTGSQLGRGHLNAFGSASLLGQGRRGRFRRGGRGVGAGTPAASHGGTLAGTPLAQGAVVGAGPSPGAGAGTGTGAGAVVTSADAGSDGQTGTQGAAETAANGAGAGGTGSGEGDGSTDARVPTPVRIGAGDGARMGAVAGASSPPLVPRSARGKSRVDTGGVTPYPSHPTHVPLPGSPSRAEGMLGGAAGMHAGRSMTGQFVWNPFEPLSAQSLLLPLAALTPEQQENHFFWLDRFYEAQSAATDARDQQEQLQRTAQQAQLQHEQLRQMRQAHGGRVPRAHIGQVHPAPATGPHARAGSGEHGSSAGSSRTVRVSPRGVRHPAPSHSITQLSLQGDGAAPVHVGAGAGGEAAAASASRADVTAPGSGAVSDDSASAMHSSV